MFGFFNGVQNTKEQANNALYFLRQTYLIETPNGKPITYELFYNDTEGFADFVETFEQRLQEHGGLLAGRFELFFSAAKGEGRWWSALIAAVPLFKDALESVFDLVRAAAIQKLTHGLGDPNSVVVAERQKAQIGHWVGRQKGLLLLAHSQGNLFVNLAYAHALTLTDAGSVKVVHVAPASPTLSGPHTLADKDLVINGLRLVGAVAANTDRIPGYAERPPGLNGERDLIGHGLLEIYLNPAVPTAARTHGHVRVAMQELESARKPKPPFPGFEPRPWLGGPPPELVRAPDDVSHQLERVVETYSVPKAFVRKDGRWTLDLSGELGEEPRSGWRRIDFAGKGMGGHEHCSWGYLPLDGWADPIWTQECTYDRIPLGYWLDSPSWPDELASYGNPANGTVVRLNTLTYSSAHVLVKDAMTSHPYVQFMSAFIPLWEREMQGRQEWVEPYVVKDGGWVNLEAYESWTAAWNAHQTSELRRLERYQEERDAYEASDCAK
ncbi:hypothetical protein [Hydrogenophaga sp.]|uniref:hypothetical protein n=1 Tax=Hydrogenophaga sp. TaxID=1904254 RepID=UPI002633B224|nr:hypothetical protein [Hydrogenophaga sp.]MCW5654019.1 hypothetical protein [Hydrogenophaga sp.]